jgi:hypothetical protein
MANVKTERMTFADLGSTAVLEFCAVEQAWRASIDGEFLDFYPSLALARAAVRSEWKALC